MQRLPIHRPCVLTSIVIAFLTCDSLFANDAPPRLAISEIQGSAHCSPFEGRLVTTRGLVTAVLRQGFYLQDPDDDGDSSTSEGIFIFTNGVPGVIAGDDVVVQGEAVEFVPRRRRSTDLSCTEIESTRVTLLATDRQLPPETILGARGRSPPNTVIDDDNLSDFDPTVDGIDFYESLEGMRVRVENSVSVSPTNRFGEVFVVADNGEHATGRNIRGGVTRVASDAHPERIQVQLCEDLLPHLPPVVDVGTPLGSIHGILGYDFGNFEILATSAPVASPTHIERETTHLEPSSDHFTVASLNVANLDAHVERRSRVSREADIDDDFRDGKFATLALQIVRNLNCPDIVALQEIQDNDGAEDSTTVDASQTLDLLVWTVRAASGPLYEHVDLPPIDDEDGGQPGGNIRVAFLYNPERVTLLQTKRLLDEDLADGDAFVHSRKPLIAKFDVQGITVHVINNHFISRTRSTPLFGRIQPPEHPDQNQRTAQARLVWEYARKLLRGDPSARLIVLGDLNAYDFEFPLRVLGGFDRSLLRNLMHRVSPPERYTTIFDGNAQALDHILVSASLARNAELDIVHTNAEFANQASDHDPLVARLRLDSATTVPLTLGERLSARAVDQASFEFDAVQGEELRIEIATEEPARSLRSEVTVALLGPIPPFVLKQASGSIPQTIVHRTTTTGKYSVIVLGSPLNARGFRGHLLLRITSS